MLPGFPVSDWNCPLGRIPRRNGIMHERLRNWTQKNQEKLKKRLWTILDGHV